MASIRVEAAVIEPRYGTETGGTGFLECRAPSGALINLHVDGSMVGVVVHEQVRALCALAGMDEASARAEADRATRMALGSLEGNRALRR